MTQPWWKRKTLEVVKGSPKNENDNINKLRFLYFTIILFLLTIFFIKLNATLLRGSVHFYEN